jgi:hypothetical protein
MARMPDPVSVGAGREFLQPLPPHLGSIKAMLLAASVARE